MADHAKKGRPRKPAKGKGGKGKKTATPNKPRLLLMLGVILLICGAFGYFLLYIDGSAEQTVDTAASSTVTAPVKPLPQAPTKSWDYEKLDQKEVGVELPQHQQSTRSYRLQCGSFRSMAQAESLKATIAFQGFESFIKQVKGKKSTWHQVYLGPFATKRAAEAARHKLQRAGLNYCEILYWQG